MICAAPLPTSRTAGSIGGGDVVLINWQSEKSLDLRHRRLGRSTLDRLGALTHTAIELPATRCAATVSALAFSLVVEPPTARSLAMHRRWRPLCVSVAPLWLVDGVPVDAEAVTTEQQNVAVAADRGLTRCCS